MSAFTFESQPTVYQVVPTPGTNGPAFEIRELPADDCGQLSAITAHIRRHLVQDAGAVPYFFGVASALIWARKKHFGNAPSRRGATTWNRFLRDLGLSRQRYSDYALGFAIFQRLSQSDSSRQSGVLPTNLHQVLALRGLTASDEVRVWLAAVQLAKVRLVTSRIIRRARRSVFGETATVRPASIRRDISGEFAAQAPSPSPDRRILVSIARHCERAARIIDRLPRSPETELASIEIKRAIIRAKSPDRQDVVAKTPATSPANTAGTQLNLLELPEFTPATPPYQTKSA